MERDENAVSQPLHFWETLVKKVAFAAGADQSRPALTGILLQNTRQKTQVVCTDGFRLAIWEPTERFTQDDSPLSAIVVAKAVSDLVTIADILDEESVSFICDAVNEQVVFAGTRFLFFSKLINAVYPPFEKIVPLEFASEITLDRELLIKNLAKASVFTKADSNTVKLTIGEENLDFTANSLGEGSFTGCQELMKKTGESVEISFNIKYLLDFLNTCQGETVWAGFNGPLSPAAIKDPNDQSLQYIAMPFKPKTT